MAEGGIPRWVTWLAMIVVALVVWALISSSVSRSNDNAGKTACELVNGAGLCVKNANGDWVRIGS
jgi:hypothetical protein